MHNDIDNCNDDYDNNNNKIIMIMMILRMEAKIYTMHRDIHSY